MRFETVAPHVLACVFALSFFGCGTVEQGLSDPCEADCNTSALIGSPCAVATDCAEGNACDPSFPGGYCVGACADGAAHGDPCGEGGWCVATAEMEVPICLAGCDAALPSSCPRDGTACYPLAGVSGGVCHLQCLSDADCGGLGCDGAGVCRSPTACQVQTGAGCPAGMSCFQTAVGSFCGLNGGGHVGEACAADAQCLAGAVCVGGVCQTRCDPDQLLACGDYDACVPIAGNPTEGTCRLP